MRRYLCFTIAVLVMFLCGCGAGGEASDSSDYLIDYSFTAKASITYNNQDVAAVITRPSPGVCKVDVTSPDSLSGLSAMVEDNNVIYIYKGINLDTVMSEDSESSFVEIMSECLDVCAVRGGAFFSTEGGVVTVTGSTNYGEFMLTADSSGNIKSLVSKDCGLDITFSDFVKQQ